MVREALPEKMSGEKPEGATGITRGHVARPKALSLWYMCKQKNEVSRILMTLIDL